MQIFGGWVGNNSHAQNAPSTSMYSSTLHKETLPMFLLQPLMETCEWRTIDSTEVRASLQGARYVLGSDRVNDVEIGSAIRAHLSIYFQRKYPCLSRKEATDLLALVRNMFLRPRAFISCAFEELFIVSFHSLPSSKRVYPKN